MICYHLPTRFVCYAMRQRRVLFDGMISCHHGTHLPVSTFFLLCFPSNQMTFLHYFYAIYFPSNQMTFLHFQMSA